MKLGIYDCPVCGGPIARWVIRARFTCHHCKRALASNLEASIRRAFVLAVALEVLLFGVIWLVRGSALEATGTYLYVACFGGMGVWVVAMQLGLRLWPLHLQRGAHDGPAA